MNIKKFLWVPTIIIASPLVVVSCNVSSSEKEPTTNDKKALASNLDSYGYVPTLDKNLKSIKDLEKESIIFENPSEESEIDMDTFEFLEFEVVKILLPKSGSKDIKIIVKTSIKDIDDWFQFYSYNISTLINYNQDIKPLTNEEFQTKLDDMFSDEEKSELYESVDEELQKNWDNYETNYFEDFVTKLKNPSDSLHKRIVNIIENFLNPYSLAGDEYKLLQSDLNFEQINNEYKLKFSFSFTYDGKKPTTGFESIRNFRSKQ